MNFQNLLFIMFHFKLIFSTFDRCAFTDERGYTAKLRDLNKPGFWVIRETLPDSQLFGIDFTFNVCDNFPVC
jgi:hypothetical protein